jgi:hypothetical protein
MSQPLIFSCDIPSTGSIVQEQVKQSAWQLRAMTNNVCYRYHDGEPRNLPGASLNCRHRALGRQDPATLNVLEYQGLILNDPSKRSIQTIHPNN